MAYKMVRFKLACEKMSEYYESLLESGQLSDVVLVAGNKELRAHKAILAARSPVFAAMFAHASTKESQQNRVEIIDVDVEVLELLIRYIYSGKVDMLDQCAADLFMTADMYQLDCLKSICEKQLLCQITAESVSELFIFADIYQVTELYNKCREYITENGTQVIATDGWKKIQAKIDLLTKLYEHLYSKYSNAIYVYNFKKIDLEMEDYSDIDWTHGPHLEFENYLLKYSNSIINCKEDISHIVLVAGNVELKVHKLLFSTRSPVLAAMFAHKSTTKGAQDNRVKITDVNAEVLKLLINYIYTDKVEELDRYAEELWVAAHKYQIECLKSICEQQLLSNVITAESVSDLLLLADLYQSEKLFTKCLKYINENGPEVIGSLRWKKIVVKTDLLTKVCEHLNWDFYEQQLLTPITIESVSNLLILADKHQATEMIAECVEYIIENGSQVMQQEDWKKIVLKADLVAKLYEHLSLKYSKVLEERANRFARYGDYSDSDLSYDSSDYDCDYGCDYDSEFYNSNCSS